MTNSTIDQPPPQGTVIGYSYLWHREHLDGQEEDVKDRPVVVLGDHNGYAIVAPVSTKDPGEDGVRIPDRTRMRLGLDQECWVIIGETNVFAWPGPDLRHANAGADPFYVYGLLPEALTQRIVQLAANADTQWVQRTE